MDGCKTIVSFWGPGPFSGARLCLLVSGRVIIRIIPKIPKLFQQLLIPETFDITFRSRSWTAAAGWANVERRSTAKGGWSSTATIGGMLGFFGCCILWVTGWNYETWSWRFEIHLTMLWCYKSPIFSDLKSRNTLRMPSQMPFVKALRGHRPVNQAHGKESFHTRQDIGYCCVFV